MNNCMRKENIKSENDTGTIKERNIFISGICTPLISWLLFIIYDMFIELSFESSDFSFFITVSFAATAVFNIAAIVLYILFNNRHHTKLYDSAAWIFGYILSGTISSLYLINQVSHNKFIIYQHSTGEMFDLNGIEYMLYAIIVLPAILIAVIIYQLIKNIIIPVIRKHKK